MAGIVKSKILAAFELHNAGNLAEAERAYRKLLSRDPLHHEVNQLLGALCLQTDRFDDAIFFLERATRVAPNVAVSHGNLALSFVKKKRPERALSHGRRAVELNPDYADGHNNLGLALLDLGRFEEAVSAFEKMIRLSPDNPQGYVNRAGALMTLGRFADAKADAERALSLAPSLPQAHVAVGRVMATEQRFEAAVQSFSNALVLKADLADAYAARGKAYLALQNWPFAERDLRQATTVDPANAEAWFDLGSVLQKTSRDSDSLKAYEHGLAVAPRFVEAWNNRGIALHQLGAFEEAAASFSEAIRLRSDYADAHCNLGQTLEELGRFDEAIERCQTALALRSGYAEALNNLGNLLRIKKQFPQASACYEEAIKTDPSNELYWLNSAFCHLHAGNFSLGWERHEWRLVKQSKIVARERVERQTQLFRAGDQRGATVYLRSEQGFGDTLQFARFAPELQSRGYRVILGVPKPLLRVFESFKGVDKVIDKMAEPERYDFDHPLMSLPAALSADESIIRSFSSPYLSANPVLKERWERCLPPRLQPRVGVMWRGAPTKGLENRTIPLSQFAELLTPGINFVSLQKDLPINELALIKTHHELSHYGDQQDDFADAAAIIEQVDLVISIDTSIAHLAGAMGKEVWVLLPYAPDWRWLDARVDSPWYPSAKLYRQPRHGDWTSVLSEVRSALQSRFGVTSC